MSTQIADWQLIVRSESVWLHRVRGSLLVPVHGTCAIIQQSQGNLLKDLILIRHFATAYRLQCKSCSSFLLIWIVADWTWGIEFESRSEEEISNMARKWRNWLGCWFRNWLYKVSVHRYNVLWCFYSRPYSTHVCSVVRFGCGSVLLLMGGWNLCVWTALICKAVWYSNLHMYIVCWSFPEILNIRSTINTYIHLSIICYFPNIAPKSSKKII